MTLYFDKNTAMERSIDLDFVNMNLDVQRISANKSIKVEEGFNPPDLSLLEHDREFNTINLFGNGVEIPIAVNVNFIDSIIVSYNDDIYTISLSICFKDE